MTRTASWLSVPSTPTLPPARGAEDDPQLPYCDVAGLLFFHTVQLVGGLLRAGPKAPPPSYMAMCDPQSPAGASLRALGLAVTGEVEASCFEGGQYRPEDLRELGEPLRERLRKFVADLWLWRAAERWGRRAVDPTKVPGAALALEDLAKLKGGVALFGPPVSRVGGTVIVRGYRLELAPQLADILERALAPGGYSFDAAREEFGLAPGEENQIRARVAKLKEAVGKLTKAAPFRIDITTRGGAVTAVIHPR